MRLDIGKDMQLGMNRRWLDANASAVIVPNPDS
jgi:hypothetical protein